MTDERKQVPQQKKKGRRYSPATRVVRRLLDRSPNDEAASAVSREPMNVAPPRHPATANCGQRVEISVEKVPAPALPMGDLPSELFGHLVVADIMGLTVQEMAEKVLCTTRHLNRLFHQHFGFSVAELRMELRLLKAVSLLRDRDTKVIRVAEQCGFNHLGLFNSCFKRRFGESPASWRRSFQSRSQGIEAQPQIMPSCSLSRLGLCPWKSSGALPTGIVEQDEDFQQALETQSPDFINQSSNRIWRNLHEVSDSTNRMLQKLDRI